MDINKYRKKKLERPSKDIQMDSWRDHYMELLGDTREKTILSMESEESEEEKTGREEVGEIAKEELIEVLRKLKKAKTLGEDEIENEAWRFIVQRNRRRILEND